MIAPEEIAKFLDENDIIEGDTFKKLKYKLI